MFFRYAEIKRKIQFQRNIPAHIVDAMSRIGVRSGVQEIFQPAEMIEITLVKKNVVEAPRRGNRALSSIQETHAGFAHEPPFHLIDYAEVLEHPITER